MKKVWWVGVLWCLSALAVGCNRDKPAPAATAGEGASAATGTRPALVKLKLALDWVPEPEFGGFYAARESGAFARHGLDVEVLGDGGAPVPQMVATGKADFGTTTADVLLVARSRGEDLVPLFAVYQTSPLGIMVHASRGITSLGQLFSTGGTLAIEPGWSYTVFLKKKYGFDKVKLVPYEGGVTRFVADKQYAQQCFFTSEPLAAKKQGAEPVVFKVADEGFNPYVTLVFTRRELLKKSPEQVRAFVEAVREGWRAYLDNPKPANEVMAKLNTTMDVETFAAIAEVQKPLIETDETRAKGLGAMSRERWETLGQQLMELGLLEKAPVVDEFLLPEFTGKGT